MTSDRGSIVLGWLTKVTLTLAVLGLIGFDVVALGVARFAAEDDAQQAARAASAAYRGPADLQRAYNAALAEVADGGSTIDAPSFSITPEGTVTLTLRQTAPTLLVEKIAPIRSWADVTTTVSATRPR